MEVLTAKLTETLAGLFSTSASDMSIDQTALASKPGENNFQEILDRKR